MNKLKIKLTTLELNMRRIGIDMKASNKEHVQMHGCELLGAAEKVRTWIDGIKKEIKDDTR